MNEAKKNFQKNFEQTKNTYSLEQIYKTRNLDASLILSQYNLDLMSLFMGIKFDIPKLTQKRLAQQLGFLNSTIKRYRDQLNMPSPCNRKITGRKKVISQNGSLDV